MRPIRYKWVRMLVLALAMPLLLLCLTDAAQATKAEARVMLEQAKVKFSAGQYSEATDLLSKVIANDPGNAEAESYLGLCKMALKDFPGAIAAFEKVVSLQAKYPDGYANLAWARLESKNAEAALKDAERAVVNEPDNGFAYFIRARARAELGQCEEAILDFQTAEEKTPGISQSAKFFSGVCYDRLGQREQAQEAFQKARDINPESELGKQAGEAASQAMTEQAAIEKPKPVAAYLRMIYQWDSNVVPIHSQDDLELLNEKVRHREDYRGVIDFNLITRPVRESRSQFTARYNLYSSYHHEATEMNLINHLGAAEYEYFSKVGDMKARSFVAGYLSSAYLDNNPYVWYFEGRPGVEFMETDFTMTHMDAFFGRETFNDSMLAGLGDYNRDNGYYGFNLSQHFLFLDNHADFMLGGRFLVKGANGMNYDYTGNGWFGGLSIQPIEPLLIIINGRYEEHDYRFSEWDAEQIIWTGTGHKVSRNDYITYLNASLQYQIAKNLAVYLGFAYINAACNVEPLDYDRTIYTVGLIGSSERLLPPFNR